MINGIDEKKKVLVVDDDEIILSIAAVMLKDNYQVLSAKSGQEAMEYLLRGPSPDVILLDIFMPEMDGWETFNRLRAVSCLKDVPIAFVTSASGTEERSRAQEIGAADFITKPLDKEVLVERLEKILEKTNS